VLIQLYLKSEVAICSTDTLRSTRSTTSLRSSRLKEINSRIRKKGQIFLISLSFGPLGRP
jgi:hypothetical protein